MLELIMSMLVLLVIAGGITSAMVHFQQSYSRTQLQSNMYENVRGVAELITQEIGQAGLVSLPSSTLSAAVTGSVTAQTVNVSSTTSMFINENVLVGAGSSEELVSLTNVTSTSITGVFLNSHASGTTLTALGVFPNGIVAPGTTDGSTSVTEPGVSVLNLFGDINGDGSLVYVRYTCDTSTTPGTLSRSVTTITPGVNTLSTAQNLLTTLIPNPSGTPCFIYTTITSNGYTLVTNVGLSLSVRTVSADPQTGQYLTMTKSFLDISPRNVLAGFELANVNNANRLQATPANVLLY